MHKFSILLSKRIFNFIFAILSWNRFIVLILFSCNSILRNVSQGFLLIHRADLVIYYFLFMLGTVSFLKFAHELVKLLSSKRGDGDIEQSSLTVIIKKFVLLCLAVLYLSWYLAVFNLSCSVLQCFICLDILQCLICLVLSCSALFVLISCSV